MGIWDDITALENRVTALKKELYDSLSSKQKQKVASYETKVQNAETFGEKERALSSLIWLLTQYKNRKEATFGDNAKGCGQLIAIILFILFILFVVFVLMKDKGLPSPR